MKAIIIISALIITSFNSCYYDIEEELYPANSNCDTSNIQYSTTIIPLLQSGGCLGCHSGGAPSGNISLESYNGVRTVALNGRLYGAISHSPGFSPMPQGGNKLTNCNISRIKSWIDAGAPNN